MTTIPSLDMSGKVAVVTGAASGIGRASAAMFAAAGAQVLACDMAEGVEETVAAIRAEGGQAEARIMDAGSEADVKATVAAAQAMGELHVFFANAGITGGIADFMEATAESWAEVLRVNLIGVFLAIRHAAPAMQAHGGGSIIATASVAGMRANAGPASYSASKAGVINLVQTAAQALAGTGVRVNAICPGLIATNMTKPIYERAKLLGAEDKLGSTNPMRRDGAPEEIASAALFLASPLASYVNGMALPVDGGLSSSHPYLPRPDAETMRRLMEAAQAAG